MALELHAGATRAGALAGGVHLNIGIALKMEEIFTRDLVRLVHALKFEGIKPDAPAAAVAGVHRDATEEHLGELVIAGRTIHRSQTPTHRSDPCRVWQTDSPMDSLAAHFTSRVASRPMSSEPRPGAEAQFEGGAFHPDLEKGRASGTVQLTAGGVRFESAGGRIELPLEGLKIALGGANDRLIFFTHPAQPEATIHTADHAILNQAVLAQNPELTVQVGRVRKKKRTARAVLFTVLLVLAGTVVALILCKDLLVTAAANGVPVDWEVKLGDKLFEQIRLTKQLVNEPALDTQFKELTAPLVTGIRDTRYPLKFHIIEEPALNAFAMPGGHVVVHTGLLLAADAPEEVAGVLAHEIAHVTERHAFRSVISSAGLYAILQFFIGDTSSLLATIANNSAFLLDRKYSRDFEREADDTGWRYLLQADIEPEGMVRFFKKMQEEEQKLLQQVPGGGSAEKALSLVSTHPATAERMRMLEGRWQQLAKKTGYRKFPLNYTEFKNSLCTKLHSAPDQKRN